MFSVYLSNNLIIPIEINSKVSKNDYEIFYYDIYEGSIQNHNSNKYINIYKYYKSKDIKRHLHFRVEYTDNEEHNLQIIVPSYDRLLSFEFGKLKRIKVKEGKTINISVNICNYINLKEYNDIKKVCS